MSVSLLETCRRTARQVFGISRLREEQEAAMVAVLEGRDALVALPTGFGKSLIYQVPAVLANRPTIVISPLIALMADQERALRSRGVPVVLLHSRMRPAERRATLARLQQGGRLIVLTTPETLSASGTAPWFVRSEPALLCIDEAHCISEWGHDFRPSYLRLGDVRDRLGRPPVLALTATATPRVRADIAERLRLRNPLVVVAPPHRENLHLAVEIVPGSQKPDALRRHIRKLRRPGIVYCATTTAVDDLFVQLRRARIPAMRYHGKMRAADRTTAQRQFMQPRRRMVLVATSAFGMGIDKPDIRYVVHYQAPGSLEAYVQEAGRAGRDGRRADCILLFDHADLEIHERLQAASRPSVLHLARLEQALAAWAAEQRAPTVAALALAAGVPRRVCEALVAKLEDAGLVERDSEGQVTVVVPPATFREGAGDLVARLKRFHLESERRRAAVAEYAATDECRSVYLRRYFGEETPPPCGVCDRCRQRFAARARSRSGSRPSMAAARG